MKEESESCTPHYSMGCKICGLFRRKFRNIDDGSFILMFLV